MSKENYDAKLAVLEALPLEIVKPPKTPIDAYLQEAEDQYVWALEDKATLKSKGLDRDLVADMKGETLEPWTLNISVLVTNSKGGLREPQSTESEG